MKNSWISPKNTQPKNNNSVLLQSLKPEAMEQLIGGSKNNCQWSRVLNDAEYFIE